MSYELENLDEFIDSLTGYSNTYGGLYSALKRIQQYGRYRFEDHDFDVSRVDELSDKVLDRLRVDYYYKHLDGGGYARLEVLHFDDNPVDVWGEIQFHPREEEEDLFINDLYLDYEDRDLVNTIMLYVIDET